MQENAGRARERHAPRFSSHASPKRSRSMPLPKTKQPPPRIQIQEPRPLLDCGRYPAKASLGDRVHVTATIFRDGHDILEAAVRYRGPGQTRWREALMHHEGNDRWGGSFEVDAC